MMDGTEGRIELRPGTALPMQEKTFGMVDLVMYGAATWDWNRMHYDADFAVSIGLPAPVIDGQVYGALFARQAVAALGPRAFIRRLGFRMRSMAFADETLRIEGKIEEVEEQAGERMVKLKQRITCGDRLISEASTEVRLPAPESSSGGE